MIPVMMTITPFGASGTMESNRLAANAWIRANFPFVIDAAEVVKDPFDASKLRNESGWINDGTHYGDNAKRAIGFYAATLSFWDFPKPSNYEVVGTSYLPPDTYTVATLPTGSSGDKAYVTDATTPTYDGALTGGGAVFTPVFHNGTAWKAGSVNSSTANSLTTARTINGVSFNGTANVLVPGNCVTNTATLDFPSIAAGASADLTITVTGAVVGYSVSMGLPSAPAAGIVWSAFVSASNTVTIRASNITLIAVDPASATYRATVFIP